MGHEVRYRVSRRELFHHRRELRPGRNWGGTASG